MDDICTLYQESGMNPLLNDHVNEIRVLGGPLDLLNLGCFLQLSVEVEVFGIQRRPTDCLQHHRDTR